MKKSLILAGMLSIGYAYAQEGRVGINTETPSATLEITPSTNNAKADAKTNEGIIAPKLSKVRIANIETPIEGTLVYATDNAYTGSNTKVSKITEKGYYFYNGTEWVKVQYQDTNDAEWVYDASTKRINLKRSYDNNNFKNMVFYDPNGGLKNVDFGINRKIESGKPYFEYNTEGTFNYFAPYNVILKQASNLGVGNTFDRYLNYNATILDKNATKANYVGIGHSYAEKGNEEVNLKQVYGIQSSSYFQNGSKIEGITGVGSHINLLNESSVEGGEVKGYRSFIEYTSPKSPQKIISNLSDLNMKGKGSSEYVIGDMKYLTFKDNNTGNIKDVVADYTHFTFSENSNPNIENIYHYKGTYFTDDTITSLGNIKNAYGLYLGDMDFASEKNYAVYTNAGKVRVGDLKGTGDRAVYVDADGVLKVGSATATPAVEVGSTKSMKCDSTNRGKMNFMKNDSGSDVFGICMRNEDGNYYWGLLIGGGNLTTGGETFFGE